MISKRSLAACLVGLNVVLAVVFYVGSVTSPPAAFGQTSGQSGDILCVTGKASGQTYDIVYMLDVPGRKLHAFVPSNPQTRQLTPAGSRDLDKDLPN